MRRRAASLLLYLVTRPQVTATREQVLEALWPDLDPTAGTNSLNQTLFFLRRDVDPHYDDGVSVNYVHNEGEVLWLDPALCSAASIRFNEAAVAAVSDTDLEARLDALSTYAGRFAPEFEYEEWAIGWRDRLHALFLHISETAQAQLTSERMLREAIQIAQKTLTIDPSAIEVERALVWLYAAAGARSSASEQYAHYAAAHREEFSADPPSLAEVAGTSPFLSGGLGLEG
jgi:DNA-binding SARP family transcriptional activator